MRSLTAALLLAIAPPIAVACGAHAASADPAASAAPLLEATLKELPPLLAAQRGKPLLVNFWAMWCPPCVAELPDLAAVASDFRARGGEVIGISLDPTAPGTDLATIRTKLVPFLAERQLGFEIVLCTEPDLLAITAALDLPGALPATLAIDANGERVAVHEGRASKQDFEELARQAAGG